MFSKVSDCQHSTLVFVETPTRILLPLDPRKDQVLSMGLFFGALAW